jgi:hypothetical protein
MKDPTHSQPSGAHEFVSRSSVYQEYLAEREEILRHKWIESEKAGKDIGFEQALQDWVRKHRDNWRANRRAGTASGLNHCNYTRQAAGADRRIEPSGPYYSFTSLCSVWRRRCLLYFFSSTFSCFVRLLRVEK